MLKRITRNPTERLWNLHLGTPHSQPPTLLTWALQREWNVFLTSIFFMKFSSPVFFQDTCHFVLFLPLGPSLLTSFTFFLLYSPAGPPQYYPWGLVSFLFFSLCLFFTATAMPSATISRKQSGPNSFLHLTSHYLSVSFPPVPAPRGRGSEVKPFSLTGMSPLLSAQKSSPHYLRSALIITSSAFLNLLRLC